MGYAAMYRRGDQFHVVADEVQLYRNPSEAHWGYCLALGNLPGCAIAHPLGRRAGVGDESASVYVPFSPSVVGIVFRRGRYVAEVDVSLNRYGALPPLAHLVDRRIQRDG
jgi:hypothetical protein